MTWGYCPLSFRTIDSVDYKKAMLMFYEQNNITAFHYIFIEQYEFVTKNYFWGDYRRDRLKRTFGRSHLYITLCLIFYKFEFNKLPYLIL